MRRLLTLAFVCAADTLRLPSAASTSALPSRCDDGHCNASSPSPSPSSPVANDSCSEAFTAGLCSRIDEHLPASSALHAQAVAHRSGDEAAQQALLRSPRTKVVWAQPNPGGGLADSWSLIVTAFYVALLTDAAFVMDAGGKESWEWGYVPHVIGAAATRSRQLALLPTPPFFASCRADWRLPSGLASELAAGAAEFRVSPMQPVASTRAARALFSRGKLDSLFSGRRVLRIWGNRGLASFLFQNPNYAARLEGLGLGQATAYGCAISFLVRLRPDACSPAVAALVAALREPNTTVVGVQVRTGDDAFRARPAEPARLAAYSAFFDCARSLGTTMRDRLGHTRVTLFVISDSMPLRRAAAAASGSHGVQILTRLSDPDALQHIRFRKGRAAAAFLFAAAEHWLFGIADAFVTTSGSNFGRSAAILRAAEGWTLSRARRPLFQVALKGKRLRGQCTLGSPEALEFPGIAKLGVGI